MNINLKKKKKKNFCKGQAMVESLLIIAFTTMFVLVGIQLVILIIDDLTYNEASFAASRIAAVSQGKNISQKIELPIRTLVSSQLSPLNSLFLNIDVKPTQLSSYSNRENTNSYDIVLNYLVHFSFAEFFNPLGINLSYRSSTAKAIISSDPEFYNKSYPGSSEFRFDWVTLSVLLRDLL